MRITRNTVVTMELEIRDERGSLLESASDKGPLRYLHGTGFLLPAVEAALEGREAGERLELLLAPEQAFGFRDEELKKVLPIQAFDESTIPLQPGESILLGEQDQEEWYVESIHDGEVLLDGNNPWAGKRLSIAAHILEVRPVTGRELWAGRALPGDEHGRQGGIYCGPACRC